MPPSEMVLENKNVPQKHAILDTELTQDQGAGGRGRGRQAEGQSVCEAGEGRGDTD